MIWLLALALMVLVPLVIWVVLLQEEASARRHRPPMGWLRRWWAPQPPPNRRHCHRYRVELPVTYQVSRPRGQTLTGSATTRDVGFGGMGLVLYEKWSVGTAVTLTLQGHPPTAGPLTVPGVVEWVREIPPSAGDPRRVFWAGIQIIYSDMALVDQWRALLSQFSSAGLRGHG